MKKLLLILLLFPTLSLAESYLCIAEASGGVYFNEQTKKFQGTSFTTDSKYILKKVNEKWAFSNFGSNFDNYEDCKEAEYFGENPNPNPDAKPFVDRLFCEIAGGQIVLDFLKLRFARTYWGGFEENAKGDTPFIEVGSCSEI